jgi:hypothetical protein
VLSAIKSHSSHSSSFQVCLPWFLGTGHWIGGTLFSRLIGSNAAVGAIGDDLRMMFERPDSEDHQSLRRL